MLNELAIVENAVKDWSEAMLQARGVEGIRVLQGLKALASKHDATSLNAACETALSHGAMRLRTIRKLLQRNSEVPQQQQFDFLTEHPVIRPLTDCSIESLHPIFRNLETSRNSYFRKLPDVPDFTG